MNAIVKTIKDDYRTIRGQRGANGKDGKWFNQLHSIYSNSLVGNGRKGCLNSCCWKQTDG